MSYPKFVINDIYEDDDCNYFDMHIECGNVTVKMPESDFNYESDDIFKQMHNEWINGPGFSDFECSDNPDLCDPIQMLNWNIKNCGIFYRRKGNIKEIIISTSNISSFTTMNIAFDIVDEESFINNLLECSNMLQSFTKFK